MTEEERNLEILKLITSAEHHFNNLTFNVRALASTCLLATFAGIGWIIKDMSDKNTALLIEKIDLVITLCCGGAIGIFVLWVLDLKVYQELLNVWFDSRKKYERDGLFPDIRIRMKALFKNGRAAELIKYYYLVIGSAPLLLALFIAFNNSSSYLSTYILISLIVFLNVVICIFSPSDKKHKCFNNN